MVDETTDTEQSDERVSWRPKPGVKPMLAGMAAALGISLGELLNRVIGDMSPNELRERGGGKR